MSETLDQLYQEFLESKSSQSSTMSPTRQSRSASPPRLSLRMCEGDRCEEIRLQLEGEQTALASEMASHKVAGSGLPSSQATSSSRRLSQRASRSPSPTREVSQADMDQLSAAIAAIPLVSVDSVMDYIRSEKAASRSRSPSPSRAASEPLAREVAASLRAQRASEPVAGAQASHRAVRRASDREKQLFSEYVASRSAGEAVVVPLARSRSPSPARSTLAAVASRSRSRSPSPARGGAPVVSRAHNIVTGMSGYVTEQEGQRRYYLDGVEVSQAEYSGAQWF